MSDPLDEDTKDLRAWSVSVSRGSAPAFLKEASESSRAAGATVLVIRADLVFGLDHLRSALYHAKRAMCEGSNSADSLEMETLLYASGERQLSSAIAKMGVTEATEKMVVARLAGNEISVGSEWKTLEDRHSASKESLRRFGITDLEMSTVSDDRLVELVMERIAAVDILKR